MILTDIHTHSNLSPDGVSPLSDMVSEAKKKQLRYYGVAEHINLDYVYGDITVQGVLNKDTTNPDAYFPQGRALQKQVNDENFTLLIGAEFGFANMAKCFEGYQAFWENYQPDFVVNSIHSVEGVEAYYPDYTQGKTKKDAYGIYLNAVRESLDAPYHYDIVAHIGYVSRNAVYEDRKLRFSEFSDILEDILREIVKKGKILEVNSSANGAGSEFLPDVDILTRYFELGGRKISFASDAHHVSRIADKRETVVKALKRIGFTHLTVPYKKQEIYVEI